MTNRAKIPRPTVLRLSLYLRELESLSEHGQRTINSRQLGDRLALTDTQVRKDLACFGQFGHPGIGYKIDDLVEQLKKILGTDRIWNAAIIGAGNVGRALMPYARFARKGFDIVAVFDTDPAVIGTTVVNHRVRGMRDLPGLVKDRDIKIGIITVPAKAAQEVAEQLIQAGILGILNFAPVRLEVRDAVSVVSVDFLQSLEQLAFQISLGLKGSIEEGESKSR
ncbi:MAG TPA: redox-sensing transcriptional repressor Rex [Phycisphaerales bacterium]|nr:redox-sensing transcriptional repressor Rex [Phycisphaerales bacterium]